MNIRTLFTIKIDLPDTNLSFPNKIPSKLEYETELIAENDLKDFILKIFYDPKEYLADTVLWWFSQKNENILSKFEILKIHSPENLIDIELKNYGIKKIQSSSYCDENLSFFLITLNGIKKVFKNNEKRSSEFYLNTQANKLVELNYRYHQNFSWLDKPYKLEPIHKRNDFLKFHQVNYKLDFNFYHSNENESTIKITKEPKFSIKYEEHSESVIRKHAEILCSLYSFYSQNKIDFFYSRIYLKDTMIIEFRKVENALAKNVHGMFIWDFYQNPENLICNVDTQKIFENFKFTQKIVERFIYSLKTSGETKFMVLYNIIEQIRNKYILNKEIEIEKAGDIPNLKNVVEEFEFKPSKTQTTKKIKNILSQITELVVDSQQEAFKNDIKYKITPIKVISLINQFNSLFDYLELDPKEYELDFIKIKSLRDSIFHGRPIYERETELESLNNYKKLPRFTATIILKFLGINKLAEIKRIE